jgi:hypothetical protein
MINSPAKNSSPLLVTIFAIAVPLIIFGLAYFIANYPPKVPWEPGSAEFEPVATLSPSGSTQVTGVVQPWRDRPTTGRHIVLCQLIDDTPMPYDCRVTSYHAITNSESRFQLDNVQPGKYLILHDSGLTDFERGYAQWHGKILRVGDFDWTMNNLFTGEPDDSFFICNGSVNGFYFSHVDLTLTASGSPFGLAHDIELASAYQGEKFTLPPGVFKPFLVEVVKDQTSDVLFKALYCTPEPH